MRSKGKAGRWQATGTGRSGAGSSQLHVHSTASPVYAQGRVVGRVRGNVFRKSVRGSRHMLRRPPAWALDVGSLLEAERLGARFVEVFDRDTGATYRADVADVRRHGFTFDRGHGRQIGLPLERWTVRRAGQPVAEQLSLFGGTP